jgi:dCTP deaminase
VSILTGPEIARRIANGLIRIDPFDESLLNPASIDLRLGPTVFTYDAENGKPERGSYLDARKTNRGSTVRLDDDASVDLEPGRLYLMHTLERVWAKRDVPIVDGKSSLGRLGVSVHQTAGYGDPGFDGQYTLEVTVVHPTRLYVGMRVAQMRFHETVGEVVQYSGRYVGDDALGPVPSKLGGPSS